jgi:hypothetical protein
MSYLQFTHKQQARKVHMLELTFPRRVDVRQAAGHKKHGVPT